MTRWVTGWVLMAGVAATASAQDAVIGQMYHPSGPLPSYEVATIKTMDPKAPGAGMTMPSGARFHCVKNYILNAYGVSTLSQEQLVGGPAWVTAEDYVIEGKAPEELRAAMLKMTNDERRDTNRKMQQSLLADRFKLKVHFETREMAVYELEPAKGGLKVTEVPAPPPFVPGTPPPPPGGGAPVMRPGMLSVRMPGPQGGAGSVLGMAMTMATLISMLRQTPEVGGRAIVDKTGFKSNFDVNLKWAGFGSGSDVDGPSFFTALEEQLGLKLKATKGMVEVLVIDSIERPTEN
jgi:bla regulator protein blaR1